MIKYPDYNNCILNLTNSIMKHYGVDNKHNTLASVDELLSRDYKNVVLLIFDGMGSFNLRNIMPEDSFLVNHIQEDILSVFPPTTTAATTTLVTGLSPIEHGWIGWSLHFDEINDNINIYLNNNYDGKEYEYNVAEKYMPFENIIDKINQKGTAKAHFVSPFAQPLVDSYDELFSRIKGICRNGEKNFMYAYWFEPDSTMHKAGSQSNETTDIIKMINSSVEKLSKELQDTNTLLLITADHGHIDIKSKCLLDYPSIMNTLNDLPSIEPRAKSFFIKDGMQDEFEKEFNKYFSDNFILLSHEQVLEKKLFGDGAMHPKSESFIGDFLAISKNENTLFEKYEDCGAYKSTHAGITEQEMTVPLIVIEC